MQAVVYRLFCTLWAIKQIVKIKLFCFLQNEHNVSFKDLQNQRVIMPTLEYHDKNWTWTDMLMELKKDYRSVIVQQTFKSALGMRGSDEAAGLVSPKAKRSVAGRYHSQQCRSVYFAIWNCYCMRLPRNPPESLLATPT